MELDLGGCRLDLRSRAIVIGSFGLFPDTGVDRALDGRAATLVAGGADAVELWLAPGIAASAVRCAVSALVDGGSEPLGCVTSSPELAAAAVAAGASFVHDRGGLRDRLLAETVGAAGVVAIVDAVDHELPDVLARATDAGLDLNRLVLAAEAVAGRRWSALTAAGLPVMASLPCPGDEGGELVGLAVTAVAAGCQLLCGTHPTALRRVADICADILEAR